MKNIFLLIVILSIQFYSSQEYPLNTSPSDIPSGAYIKDLNNEYDQYLGLWKGKWGSKTVYLELKKVKKFSFGTIHSYYKDKIFGERKIINKLGNVEVDRITNFDYEAPEFRGMGINLKNGLQKTLTFYPKNMCNKMAEIIITNFTPTQMTLHFEYLPSIYDENCIHNAYVDENDDYPMNFPKDITLTKQ